MTSSVIVVIGLLLSAPGFLRSQGRGDEVALFQALLGISLLGLIFALVWWRLWDFISEVRHERWKQRRELYLNSGVFEFVASAMGFEPHQFRRGSHHFRPVRGVVCGEEISGRVNGAHLQVTVTKPETRRAFKMLPKDFRRRTKVVYKPQ